jgi:hypothetical protein
MGAFDRYDMWGCYSHQNRRSISGTHQLPAPLFAFSDLQPHVDQSDVPIGEMPYHAVMAGHFIS